MLSLARDVFGCLVWSEFVCIFVDSEGARATHLDLSAFWWRCVVVCVVFGTLTASGTCRSPSAAVESCLGVSVGYLVDPASSHMLVSKTKPCMSKYERFRTVKLRMAH